MKLIKPSFEIQEQEPSLEGVFKQIERAGRVCYKSEDRIAEGTAKVFVDRMIASGHGAMLEHGTVYLRNTDSGTSLLEKYRFNKYSEYTNMLIGANRCQGVVSHIREHYVTTNFRVLIENEWLQDLKYLCEPTEHHHKRITVKVILDRGVSHEFVRHRVLSFAQESTRYCNYAKAKFGGSVAFIMPPWLEEVEKPEFEQDLKVIETIYFKWLSKGWTAQQARGFLCNFLKTELIMTGTIEQWEGFFKLRDAGSAHPQAYELAHPLHEEFIKRGYVTV